MNRPRLLANTLSVTSLRLLRQFLALFSGLLIANYFGATAATDDYYTALILPAPLATLIVGALTNLFAPIYARHVQQDAQQGPQIMASMMFVVTASLAAAVLICLAAVPLYTAARALPSGEAVQRAMLFGFLLVLNCPLVGYVVLLSVYSEAQQHYSIPAAVALSSPLMFIVTLLLTLPLGIYALLIANLAAGIVELALMIYAAWRLRLQLWPTFSLHPAVREMMRLSLAPGLAFLALFFVPVVDRLMAASLGLGSLTAFHYGERIVVALETMVLGGPLLVIYYYWANVSAGQGMDAVAERVPEMISVMLFGALPLCVGGALISVPVISILFERGAFTAVEAASTVLAILLLSLIFNFLIALLIRLLLLMHLVWVQLGLSIGITALNIALNIALIPAFALQGIVFSTLLTRVIIAGAALVLVGRHLPQIDFRTLLPRAAQTLLSLAAMIGAVLGLMRVLSAALGRAYGLPAQIGALTLMVMGAGAAYLCTAWLIRHRDLLALLEIAGRSRYGGLLRRVGLL